MLQLIPALLLILLQSGAEPDAARVRCHALSLMMSGQVQSEGVALPDDQLTEAFGEALTDSQVAALLDILADEPVAIEAAPVEAEPEYALPRPPLDERLPDFSLFQTLRSRDGPLFF